jgi:hypothetical protein
LEQAKHFAHAVMKGDPHERGMITGAARQLFSKLFPGRRKP